MAFFMSPYWMAISLFVIKTLTSSVVPVNSLIAFPITILASLVHKNNLKIFLKN
jgi:hypothetical protein